VLALKTWQNKNPGGTREQYDEVLANKILDHEPGTPPDLIVLAGFMHIVSEHFLRVLGHETSLPSQDTPRVLAPIPIINLHPAKPGEFDGAHAIERAFQAFQEGKIQTTGVMVHEVIAQVDRGKPVLVREVPIYGSDTVETLEERMHKVEHEIIVEGARAVLERPVASQVIHNPWDDVITSPKVEATSVMSAQDPPPAPASDEQQEERPTHGSRHMREGSENGVNDRPQFSSVRDALASWGTTSAASTSSVPPVTQQRPRRRTSSRPTSMYASRESTLEVVRETGSTIKQASFPTAAGASDVTRGGEVSLQLSPIAGAPTFDTSILDATPDSALSGKTISVEALLLSSNGSSSTLPPSDMHVLYDSEVHAIVYRYKGGDGLVATQIFARRGIKTQRDAADSPQERRLVELSKRFSCKVIDASPGREPSGLSSLLGGYLITRQGARARFDSGNTQMYIVRAEGTDCFVDQIDLVSIHCERGTKIR
jgi:folate-dependent phosphoribosylglycinamide formyltransferase PurN